METEELLNSLDQELIAEGISEEERLVRIQIVKESIESAETMIAQLKPKILAQKEKPVAKVTVGKAIELSLIALIVGWMTGIFTLYYCKAAP